MPSKEFLTFRDQIPTSPPDMGGSMPAQGGPNFYPQLELGVPMMPPDYVPPEPEIPQGFTGGKVTVGGVPGMRLGCDGLRARAALLYLHGGGFTVGSAMTAGPLLAKFAVETGLEGYAVEYSLAPYHQFPQAVEECVAFYQGLLERGYTHIVVGGESAGAGLTLSLTLALKERGIPLPAALWCSSPIDDIRFDQRDLYRRDFLAESCASIQQVYAPDADPCNPLLSPIYGDFTGFPPVIIQTGGGESLSAGAVRLAEKAARANVEVVLHFGQDMPHTFAMDYAIYPEATHAMAEILTFVNNKLALLEHLPTSE